MWMNRMSTPSPALSVDHREPEPATPPAVAPHRDGDGEAYAAQQATITHAAATPAVQHGDDSTAGDP
jgi:hypothetical protein